MGWNPIKAVRKAVAKTTKAAEKAYKETSKNVNRAARALHVESVRELHDFGQLAKNPKGYFNDVRNGFMRDMGHAKSVWDRWATGDWGSLWEQGVQETAAAFGVPARDVAWLSGNKDALAVLDKVGGAYQEGGSEAAKEMLQQEAMKYGARQAGVDPDDIGPYMAAMNQYNNNDYRAALDSLSQASGPVGKLASYGKQAYDLNVPQLANLDSSAGAALALAEKQGGKLTGVVGKAPFQAAKNVGARMTRGSAYALTSGKAPRGELDRVAAQSSGAALSQSSRPRRSGGLLGDLLSIFGL